MMIRLYLFIVGTLGVNVYAADISTVEAHAAYQQALNKVINARQSLQHGQAVSFIETTESKNGEKVSVTKTLTLNENGEEVIEPLTAEGDGLNWQSNILVNPARFPEKPALINETNSQWVFRIPTQISANTESANQEVDSEKVNNKLSSSLVSELTVSKDSPQFLSLKVYAKKPFKPEAMVKVNTFRVRMDFANAWPNGPLITQSTTRVLEGKYAIFVSVDEFSLTTYQQFQSVN